jgi:hypothetical protein
MTEFAVLATLAILLMLACAAMWGMHRSSKTAGEFRLALRLILSAIIAMLVLLHGAGPWLSGVIKLARF